MTEREKLIEAMAQALCGVQQPAGAWDRNPTDGYRDVFRAEASAALAAIEDYGAVVVPRVATSEMLEELVFQFEGDQTEYAVMLSASPYKERHE